MSKSEMKRLAECVPEIKSLADENKALKQKLAVARNEALEEAAKVADKHIEEEIHYDVIGTSRYIAKEIRALKEVK